MTLQPERQNIPLIHKFKVKPDHVKIVPLTDVLSPQVKEGAKTELWCFSSDS